MTKAPGDRSSHAQSTVATSYDPYFITTLGGVISESLRTKTAPCRPRVDHDHDLIWISVLPHHDRPTGIRGHICASCCAIAAAGSADWHAGGTSTAQRSSNFRSHWSAAPRLVGPASIDLYLSSLTSSSERGRAGCLILIRSVSASSFCCQCMPSLCAPAAWWFVTVSSVPLTVKRPASDLSHLFVQRDLE